MTKTDTPTIEPEPADPILVGDQPVSIPNDESLRNRMYRLEMCDLDEAEARIEEMTKAEKKDVERRYRAMMEGNR